MADVLWPCGTLGRPHGLHGEIYLELLPHGLEYLSVGGRFLLSREDGEELQTVAVARAGGDDRHPILRLDGAATREQAAAFSGGLLLATGGGLDELPAWRSSDLLGLRAECGERPLGIVTDVLQAPASDILQIEAEDGEVVLVPLVDELVSVDLAAGTLRVREGLL